jgi:pimeloyl-ACP methyl ester carboxylesterase
VGPVPPVRYLVAEKGGNPAFRQAAALVERSIPGSEVVTLPGLPHFAMSTEPDAFVARSLEHLRR